MKSILRFFIFIILAASFTGCVKSVEIITPAPAPSNSLAGSWTLVNASSNDGFGWVAFDPGINGVLNFDNNGYAEYDDKSISMNGTWSSVTSTDEYYDENGNDVANQHQSLQFSVADGSGNSLDLYFDYFSLITNDEFVGTFYDGKNIDRYIFQRY